MSDVCMFDKYGFCKWEGSCKKIHLKEKCLLEDCESRICQKRHPRPCKFFSEKGNCKFNEKCKFDHRQPKMIRDLICRLETVEKENKKLLRVITEQGEQIREMSEQKWESVIENLKNQVEELKTENKKKSAKIDHEIDEIKKFRQKHFEIIKEKESLDVEVELDESSQSCDNETEEEYYNMDFHYKLIEHLVSLEEDVNKLRKHSPQQMKSKLKKFNEKMHEETISIKLKGRINFYLTGLLDSFLDFEKRETEKQEVMKEIKNVKMCSTHFNGLFNSETALLFK